MTTITGGNRVTSPRLLQSALSSEEGLELSTPPVLMTNGLHPWMWPPWWPASMGSPSAFVPEKRMRCGDLPAEPTTQQARSSYAWRVLSLGQRTLKSPRHGPFQEPRGSNYGASSSGRGNMMVPFLGGYRYGSPA